MHRHKLLRWCTIAWCAALIGCSTNNTSDGTMSQTPGITLTESDWTAFSRLRVFFGHQSLGSNIVDGVAYLAQSSSRGRVVVAEGRTPPAGAAGYLLHAPIGANEDPAAKIADFAAVVTGPLGDSLDVAVVKLCYVDITERTDTAAVLRSLDSACAAITAAHPALRCIIATVPVTTIETGAKAAIKQLLGKAILRDRNLVRMQFNEALRARYAPSGQLFDLARAESTLPDGSRSLFTHRNTSCEMLYPGYTDDGGHLSAQGQQQVAAAFVRTLAAIPSNTSGGRQ